MNTVDKNVKVRCREGMVLCRRTAIFILLTCFSLMLSPVVNYSAEKGSRLSGLLLSAATWALVVVSILMVRRMILFAAEVARQDRSDCAADYRGASLGLFCFTKGTESLIAAVTFAVGLITWILRSVGLLYFEGSMRMLQYSLCSSGLLLFILFNGKSFQYIKRCAEGGKHAKSKKREKRGNVK